MGYRLSKLYTRTGDKGDTGLASGERIAKNHPRVAAMGEVDELNCHVGLMITELTDCRLHSLLTMLTPIQHRLFDLGGELAVPGYDIIDANDVTLLEQQIDQLNEHLQPLKNFILPGGSRAIAQAHLARSVCRRAERQYLSLAQQVDVNQQALIYLNRLSDLLFVMARTIARLEETPEVLWAPKPKPSA
tara:strand:- start:3044 stop:3610 length:567 start_codon:yes stop_codon:yes gene_type:complete